MAETGSGAPGAATVLLTRDDPFRVLMVHRSAGGSFASALVFPGGRVEPDDGDPYWAQLVDDFDDFAETDRALRIAAIRETWEETGILIAADTRASRAHGDSFREIVASVGGMHLGDLVPFGHWVTPVGEPRRFDTYFFLAAAPAGQEAVSDGHETVAVEWIRADAAVSLARSGERPIIFPTLMNLARLAESSTTRSAIEAARARPIVTVQPTMTVNADGSRTITMPTDAGYAETVHHVPPA